MNRAEAIASLTAPGQTYELEVVETARGPVRAFRNAPPSLRALFEATASDRPFIVYEDERYTFRETYVRAARTARLLVDEYGIGAGERVAISMRNFPEWITAFMAVTSLSAIAVAMNALWQPEEMEYGLADSGARVLFADEERVARLRNITTDIAIVPVRTSANTLAELLAPISECEMPDATIAPDDPATIFYTSGSTGNPKGVVSTHRNVVSALLSWELDTFAAARVARGDAKPPERTGRKVQDAALLAVPLFHVTGSHAVYLSSYRAQRKLVCMYKWDPDVAAELIEREQVNSFIAPPAMTGDLVRLATTSKRDLSSLRVVGGGGAPRAPEQVRQIDASFEKVAPNTGWGMTETNAIGAGISGTDYVDHPASSGRCSAVLDLRVVDDTGMPCERGELQVRGASVFAGYWNRPDVDAEVFDDGWFRTGDVAYLDADGYVFIVDRIKDLIIRGGENIGCGHVEAALLMHPDVHEVAVYAVPDDRLGEEVGATIHATAGLDIDALREFLAQHLARFEVPRYITTSAAPLPRIASGKIFKRQLRDEAVASITAR
ncbi:MAG: class I adenylate-forming enzyme family protein [Acidimicrobiia bacterium]